MHRNNEAGVSSMEAIESDCPEFIAKSTKVDSLSNEIVNPRSYGGKEFAKPPITATQNLTSDTKIRFPESVCDISVTNKTDVDSSIKSWTFSSYTLSSFIPFLNEYVSKLFLSRSVSFENVVKILSRCTKLQCLTFGDIIFDSTNDSAVKQICLPFLQTLNFTVTKSGVNYISENSQMLLLFLSKIRYGLLSSVDLNCTNTQLIVFPIPHPFVPNFGETSSLTDLLYENRSTLRQFFAGPSEDRFYIQLQVPPIQDADDFMNGNEIEKEGRVETDQDETEETQHYDKDETEQEVMDTTEQRKKEITNIEKPSNELPRSQFEMFVSSSKFPIPEWWTCMLKEQHNLKKLCTSFMNPKIWEDIIQAAVQSYKTLEILDVTGFAGESTMLDLRPLNQCRKLKVLHLMCTDYKIKNFHKLPPSIRRLRFSALVFDRSYIPLIKNLNRLTELTLVLHKMEFPVDDIPTPYNIIDRPFFNELLELRYFESLKVESEDICLDLETPREWCKTKEGFSFLEVSGSDSPYEYHIQIPPKDSQMLFDSDEEILEPLEETSSEDDICRALFRCFI